MEYSDVSAEEIVPWSVARVAGYSTLVAVVFFAAQIAAMFVVLASRLVNDPDLDIDQWAAELESDGFLLSLASVFSALLCVPLVKFLVGRREADAWAFLRIGATDARSVLAWILTLVAFVVVSDSLNLAMGRPIVHEFMKEAYSSAHPALLFVALVFAAPVSEEIFFRGFVLGGLESSGVSTLFAAVISSFAWAALHSQYELLDLATVFLLGLLLAAARTRTGSLIPCLAMHSLTNAIAFAETVIASRSAVI